MPAGSPEILTFSPPASLNNATPELNVTSPYVPFILVLLSKIINRSEIKFSTSITSSDKIITLSTCHNDKERLVLHAKLIKYELK